MKSSLSLAAALLLAGCGSIPADPDDSLERIRGEGRFSVGLIGSGPSAPAPEGAEALLGRLSRATGARPAVEHGSAEALLSRLEEGGLDLVIGEFAEQSPWAARVTLSEPIAAQGRTMLAAAARNGENAWIALVHREARAAAPGRR
jgi:ABC-type amino acid transport substrate-binding protein